MQSTRSSHDTKNAFFLNRKSFKNPTEFSSTPERICVKDDYNPGKKKKKTTLVSGLILRESKFLTCYALFGISSFDEIIPEALSPSSLVHLTFSSNYRGQYFRHEYLYCLILYSLSAN